MPFKTKSERKRKPPNYYPWDKWLSGRFFLIRRGLDYDCRTSVMAQMIRNYASKWGYRVSIKTSDDERHLEVSIVEKPNPF